MGTSTPTPIPILTVFIFFAGGIAAGVCIERVDMRLEPEALDPTTALVAGTVKLPSPVVTTALVAVAQYPYTMQAYSRYQVQ